MLEALHLQFPELCNSTQTNSQVRDDVLFKVTQYFRSRFLILYQDRTHDGVQVSWRKGLVGHLWGICLPIGLTYGQTPLRHAMWAARSHETIHIHRLSPQLQHLLFPCRETSTSTWRVHFRSR